MTFEFVLPYRRAKEIVPANVFVHGGPFGMRGLCVYSSGPLQSSHDLARIRMAVAAKQEPIYSGYDDNLLLKGFEYTVKYNLGEEVPFVKTLDRTGNYHHTRIAPKGRSGFRAVFEEIYSHCVNRAGLNSPSLKQVVERIRPEGVGGPAADHVGFGTLLFAQPDASAATTRTQTPPAPPGAVIAQGSPQENQLTWVASVGAENYTDKRATKDGDYLIIARNIAATAYTDHDVQAGEVDLYVVTAVNASGESPDSHPTVARYVPQTSSQSSQLGLMMRSGPAADAANVSLVLGAEQSGERRWQVGLTSRNTPGANTVVPQFSLDLSEPIVTHGRLTGGCWLKLLRSGDTFRGSISSDGVTWTQVGSETVPLQDEPACLWGHVGTVRT